MGLGREYGSAPVQLLVRSEGVHCHSVRGCRAASPVVVDTL